MSRSDAFAVGLMLIGLAGYAAVGRDEPQAGQADLRSTICQVGYSRTHRLYESDRAAYYHLRDEAFARAGIPVALQCHGEDDPRSDCFILDDIVPLELFEPGERQTLGNFQVQRRDVAHAKDLRENKARWDYCKGLIELSEARERFKKD